MEVTFKMLMLYIIIKLLVCVLSFFSYGLTLLQCHVLSPTRLLCPWDSPGISTLSMRVEKPRFLIAGGKTC